MGILAFFGVLGAIFMAANRKRRQDEEKRRKAMQREIRIEKLMLLSDKEIQDKLYISDLYVIRQRQVSQETVFDAIRDGAEQVACIGDLDSDTKRLFHTYMSQATLISLDELIKRLRPPCTETEIDARLNPKEKKRPHMQSLFKKLTGNKYLLLGIVLYVLSFVTKYQLYYRLIGSLCFGLSALSAVFRPKESA